MECTFPEDLSVFIHWITWTTQCSQVSSLYLASLPHFSVICRLIIFVVIYFCGKRNFNVFPVTLTLIVFLWPEVFQQRRRPWSWGGKVKIDHDRVCGMKAMIFRPKRCASFSFLSLKLLLNEASYDKIYPMKINQK